ncbi:MAG TPA: branched chain amino acid aminotransferase, partial [Flavobacterium sp.]|nr:branched chain amino acid aminotransferase [Flavobacterium sp.]
MTPSMTHQIEIIKASTSKINSVDFENLTFGSTFTDHMLMCEFKDGQWQQPIIKPYAPLSL